jgi:hypothetical protein
VYPDAPDELFGTDTYTVDNDCFGFSPEDKICLLEKGAAALSLQCDAGEKAYGSSMIAHHYRGMAYFAAQLGQTDRALGYLETALDYLSAAINQQISGVHYAHQSLMLIGQMDPAFDNAFHRVRIFRKYLETCHEFSDIRENKRYNKIIACLDRWLTPENCTKYFA